MDDDHDDLDRMLRAAAPRTPVADRAEPAQLDAMIAAARGERGGRLTRMPRVAVAGVVAGALVLGGGAAAAASVALSAYIPNPVLVQTYELPSGAMCTLTMGRMIGGSAEIRDAAREVFAGIDVPSDAEIQWGIDAQRAEQDRYAVAEDGTRTPAYYGTPGYKSADEGTRRPSIGRSTTSWIAGSRSAGSRSARPCRSRWPRSPTARGRSGDRCRRAGDGGPARARARRAAAPRAPGGGG